MYMHREREKRSIADTTLEWSLPFGARLLIVVVVLPEGFGGDGEPARVSGPLRARGQRSRTALPMTDALALLTFCAVRFRLVFLSVSQLLLEMADDFIEDVATFGCMLAKHRGSDTLDVQDVQLHLGMSTRSYCPLAPVLIECFLCLSVSLPLSLSLSRSRSLSHTHTLSLSVCLSVYWWVGGCVVD